jgi:hypothetical protein
MGVEVGQRWKHQSNRVFLVVGLTEGGDPPIGNVTQISKAIDVVDLVPLDVMCHDKTGALYLKRYDGYLDKPMVLYREPDKENQTAARSVESFLGENENNGMPRFRMVSEECVNKTEI